MTQEQLQADFKRQFWLWFDSKPTEFKQLYWYYKADIAEVYFYNKVYVYPQFQRNNFDFWGQKG